MSAQPPERLISVGGFLPPRYLYPPVTLTYRVRNPLRRWWLRRHGWSTEWTVEYDWAPVHNLLPVFTATRGGISYR